MSKRYLIGSSNSYTNNTNVFGSMAGLNSNVCLRPWVTSIPGYKYERTAANGVDWITGASLNSTDIANGCGYNKGINNATKCISYIGPKALIYYDPPRLRMLN